jgi:two-component system sensor histidine kinase PilS (NtrC family)
VEGLALVGELAAGIAHEIRNPMASISGSIQMMKEGLAKDDVNSRLMDIVLREINRLNGMISDFLVFARPRDLKPQTCDLNQLVDDSLELFRNSQHWRKKVCVQTELGQDVTLHSDPEQIKQILWNLYLNAVEAMPRGGTLYVMTGLRDEGGLKRQGNGQVQILVRDTGEGFSERALAHLFTPFYTTKEKGSGLGLATVKRIVDTLRGNIQGSNHPRGGAQVTVSLPRRLSGAGALKAAA